MANINSVITYNANLSPAQAQIKALTGQIAGLTAAFNTLDKAALSTQRSLASTFAAGVGQIGGFTAKTVQATSAVETFGKQIAANRLGMRDYFREAITGYTRQNSLMRQLATQQVRYQQSMAVPIGGGQAMMLTPQSINAASSAAALASQRFSIFNQLVNGGATAMLNWGKNTQWAGRQLMVGFTVPLMLFTAVASKQFRELDKELTRFQKVYGSDLGGAMSDATARMREDVKQLAFEISRTYGIAAKETAALAADIAATGQEGEQLMASVQQTTRLAVLGEVDRQEAMKATLALQSAFRLNTNELAESINFLNAVENQTSATLEDLSTAIPKVGPVVRSLGGDIKDLAELLVAMREGGIPAAEAANALKSGLASLINPTKQAAEVARGFGVDLVGIVEANRGQLMPTIYAMRDALAGLDSFSRSRIIEQIFGKYQFARITALFDNIGRLGSQTQSVVDLASKSSAELAAIANGEIRTLTESTAVKFQRTLENLKNSIMPIGQVLTETLIPIFEFIGKGMNTFISFFQALPEPVKNFAKYGVAIAALAGPVIMLVGLFGNLIANGIKFGMMMTRLGARIAGIKTEKFELLNEDVMAAKLGIDRLTTSFDTQEVALRRLTGVLSSYEASLKRLTTANPALFIPGAIPGARGQIPIRRQAGSTSPEFVPGSGSGDKIPAMLEPGEFIVNRAATEKYAPVLMAMNRGNLPGFQQGSTAAAHTSMPFAANTKQFAMAMTWMASSAKYGKDFIDFAMKFPEAIKVVSKSVAILPAQLNQALKTGVTSKEFISGWNQTGGGKFAPSAIQGGFDMAQKGAAKALTDFSNRVRDEAVRVAKATNNGKVNDDILAKAQKKVISEIQQTATSQDPVQIASKNLARAIENQALRLGAVRVYATPEMIRSDKKFKTDAAGNVMYGNLPVRREGDRDVRYAAPRYLAGGMEKDVASTRMIAAADKLSTAGVIMSSAFGQFKTQSGAAVGIPARGAGGGGYLTTGRAMDLVQKEIELTTNQAVEKLLTTLVMAVRKSIESGSPSKRAQREMGQEGKNLGDGALIGLRQGFKSAVTGKQIVAGPVGGTGIESISNAQKVAQADQAILKLKDMQLKHTADRVRADVELVALSRRYASGEINLIQFLEQKKQIELQKKDAAEKELRIQNLINQKKQAIVDADQAQLRAEQEEARAAAKRAAAAASPMFGIGAGGSMGYFRSGQSPYGSGQLSAAAFDRKVADISRMAGPSFAIGGRSVSTGPNASLNAARDEANGGMRGMNAMNAMFALSMVTSSISMMGGASSEAAAKLGLFTTALMTATMMMNMGIGKNTFTNFLGMRSLGGKLGQTNAARLAANPALAQRAASIASAGGIAGGRMAGQGVASGLAAGGGRMGGMLLGASRVLSVAGGPIGIAAGLGITAAITGFMMYRNAAEEARERAIAAFNDPVKSAEYFGETITSVSDILENNRLSNISEDLQGIDDALRGAVREDYAPLIEQIKFLSAGAGAQQLSVAYSNMILSGMSAENAKAAVEAIAAEAGIAGGEAFNEAVSQGMIGEMTTSEAVQNVVGQFRPGDQQYGKTGESMASVLSSDIQELEKRRLEIEQLFAKGGRNLELIDEYNRLGDEIDALKDRLEDLSTVNPEMISGVLDSLVMAYQQDPTAAIDGIKEFTDTINTLDEGDQQAAMEKITDYLKNAYGQEWTEVGATIDTQEEKIVAIQMAIAGVSLSKAINEAGQFDLALAEATVSAKSLADATKLLRIEAEESYFSMIDQFAQEQRDAANLNYENYSNAMGERIKLYEDLKESAQSTFEVEQEGRQNSIDGMQEEMDARRRDFDEQMQQLDDRREAIEKSSEAYINSLEKNQKAESFYAQQRKTAFGALEKLASGDVFGFLQEREQMSTDAQEFSYDQMITGIEERRDRELEAIDEVREQKQKEQDEYEQMMEDRIKGVQDLMDAEQEAHDERMGFYDKQIERANTAKENALKDKNEEIDGLRNIEKDYREDSEAAEQKYSKKYSELKTKPYTDARKEAAKLRVEEIYYRGGVSLGTAVVQAGLLDQRGPGAVSGGTAQLLRELGITGNPTDVYVENNVGDTGVGDNLSQTVQQMNVDATNVTINGDVAGDGGIDGDPETPMATGGYVSGPGGPKSDVIPAMLSNGEYVIQASSVSKYGKDLMDTINTGKFSYGGYVSADRAEYQASRKPKYSGGTPTYSGGYSYTNSQAEGRFGGSKNKWISTALEKTRKLRPGIDYPVFNAPTFQEELSGFWNSLRAGIATATDALATQWIPPFLRNSSNSTTALGRYIGGQNYTGSDSLTKASMFASLLPFGKSGKSAATGYHMTDITGLTSILGSGAKARGTGVEGSGFYTSTSLKKLLEIYQGGSATTPWMGIGDFVIRGKSSDGKIYNMSLDERLKLDSGGAEAFQGLSDKLASEGYIGMNIPFRGGGNMVKYVADDAFSATHVLYQGPNGLIRAKVDDLSSKTPAEIIKSLGIPDRKVEKSFRNKYGKAANIPDWMAPFITGFANGGLVQKFAKGGKATNPPQRGLYGALSLLNKEKNAPATTSMPNVGGTGSPTAPNPTSTNLISHPSQGGPNRWPYAGYPQGTGKIPGTGVSVSMNKDVLPLFLAFASDYNRLIRPINTIYGIGSRSGNYSNHPSGTAVDINPSQEGQYFGWGQSIAQKSAVLDWWRGKKSSLAPWQSVSPIPYKTVNSLMSKYKILQWFGPQSLGGFITDELGNSDPMHFQITQSRTVSPGEVSQTISSLGINPDGTFNAPRTYAAGGFISGPGGPRSDMIPAMLSNGEYVVKASAVSKYGKGFMDQINSGALNPFEGASIQPRMFANGGMAGIGPKSPSFMLPSLNDSPVGLTNNNYGGNSSSTNNSTSVKVVINGAGGKSANSIANKVISMINSANNRRNHSRSI